MHFICQRAIDYILKIIQTAPLPVGPWRRPAHKRAADPECHTVELNLVKRKPSENYVLNRPARAGTGHEGWITHIENEGRLPGSVTE